ncbi:hypothetical protein [Mesorhizobium sp. M0323]|uniref:hypothetical protein n=1 Tax=unclassified Mesorhizobium TaxID=325217 RepID=UPI00333A010F
MFQQSGAKDPASASEGRATIKSRPFQAVTTKYQGGTTAAEACKAYDEVIAAIEG